MKVHSDTLTADSIRAAIDVIPGVSIIGLTTHGSRSRKAAFNIQLTGSGVRGGMHGNLDYPTATWDEWGIVIAALYELDPQAHWGKVYESEEHFHWVTCSRFSYLTTEAQHKRHKWNAQGLVATGSYYVFNCKCGAHMRSLATQRGYKVSDVIG